MIRVSILILIVSDVIFSIFLIFAVFRYSSLNSLSGETFMDFSHRAAVKSIQNQSKHRFIYLSL